MPYRSGIFLAAIALGALGLMVVLLGGERRKQVDIEARESIRKIASGEEIPLEVAARLPKQAVEWTAPSRRGSGVGIPAAFDGKESLEDRLGLSDRERSKLRKRGKQPEAKKLRYRIRAADGWEIYRVPRQIRERFLETREAMMLALDVAGKQASSASGREGFQITSIRPGSLMEETGLQPGDVILSVNGRPVSGDADGRRLYAELKHEDRFWLVVDRSGEIRNLYYQVGDPRKG